MEFYLNQKSLPMIRKCGNCQFFYKDFSSCSITRVTSAYDHEKNIYLTVGENLYCNKHSFRNEITLREEAIVVEYDSIKDAMKVINDAKTIKNVKNSIFNDEDE